MKLRFGWVAVGTMIAAILGASGAQAVETYGLGGGNDIPNNSVLVLAQGQRAENFASGIVENIGSQPAEIEFATAGVPSDVELTSSATNFVLKPKEVKEVRLTVAVGDQAAPGQSRLTAQFKQVNLPKSGESGVVYSPAVTMNFRMKVSGTAGTANITAVADGTTTPLNGQFSITLPRKSGRGLVVARATGTGLSARLAPGPYVALFEIPGLATKAQNFNVAANQQVDVVIPVKAVSFFQTAVKPNPPSGEPVSAELLATVSNDVQPIKGPVTIEVQVSLNDEPLETVTLEKLDVLKSGLTDVDDTYVPAGGWNPGTYRFTFITETPEFTIEAANPQVIEVSWWTLPKKLIAGALLLALLVLIVFLVRRFRHR